MRGRPGTAALLLLLGGCTVWTETFPPSPPGGPPVVHNDMKTGVVLLHPDCPVFDHPAPSPSPRIAPLVALAAPLIASALVSITSDYVKRSATDLTGTFLASGSGSLADGTGFRRQCLIVAHGLYGASSRPWADTSPEATQMQGLGFTGPPDFWLEARLVPASGGKQLLVTPVYLRFRDTVARNPGNGTKNIGVVIAASHAPTELSTGAAAADVAKEADLAAPFDFGAVRWGTVLEQGQDGTNLFGNQTRALTLAAKAGSPGDAVVNISAFVTESAHSGEVETLMANALNANSKQITDFISGSIAPARTAGGAK